jgi:opacity protein-like surface antigen
LTQGALDDTGILFEVGAGYNFTRDIFTELTYQRSMLDIANIDSGYLSLNYQLSDVVLSPSIGIVGGYGRLKWSERPSIMLVNQKLTSTNYLYGAQVGLSLPIGDELYLTAKYQYLKIDHIMNIRNDTNIIEHNEVQNVLLGVKYEF